MAESVTKAPKKSMVLNILKVVGICLGAVFGLIGVSLGIIAIAGGFNPPYVELVDLQFEQNVYVIDGNLEKLSIQDGDAYHIDYKTRVDEEENPIYEVIRAIPTNEDCTELDAVLKIETGNSSIEVVTDANTKVYGQTETDDDDDENDDEWHSTFSIKLNSDIKIRPVKETKTFIDENGETFTREVNKGGWTLLTVTQGFHLAYCFVFVDVPVYEYQIVAESQNGGLVAYQPTGEEEEDAYIPNYLVNNTAENGKAFSFTVKNGTAIPTQCFKTVAIDDTNDPSSGYTSGQLRFDLRREVRKLYPRVYKQIIYQSSDESVATVKQNDDNTVTVTILPNSYGKTFEISSYVVSLYKDEDKIPKLEDYKKLYPDGEAEAKYLEDFNKLRKFSRNTIKFQVTEIELSSFEVSQTELNYYVFDQSQLILTRAGSSRANSKSEDSSTYNFTIELNQHFSDEQAILDEFLNNIKVVAGYKTIDGEFVEYDEDGAVYVQVDDFGTKKLIVNRQDSNLTYLKFEYKPNAEGEEESAYTVYCPIHILVHNATVSINKSKLDLKYFKKMVDGETNSNNIIDFDNLKDWEGDYDLHATITAEDGKLTYSRIMYFINFAAEEQFLQIDSTQKIHISGDDFYALSYLADGSDEAVNHIAQILSSGLNARLVVAIVKTDMPNGEGEVLVDEEGNIEYHAIATYTSSAPQFVSVSAEEQFEIDKCVLVIGTDPTLNMETDDYEGNVIDLYNTTENPVLALSKLDLEGNNTYATLIMTYYGPKNDNSNFFVDFTRLNGVITYSTTSEMNVDYDADHIYYLTFTANTNGSAVVAIQAYSNPVWSKTITFNVSEDIINTLVMTNDDAHDYIVDVNFVVDANSITFEDVLFDLQIVPSDSQASTTFARSFSFTQAFKDSLCEQLDMDSASATTKEILAKLNLPQYEEVRKSLGELVSDSEIVDISEYESLDTELCAKIMSGGEALVIVFAMTNNQINLVTNAYIVSVPDFVLGSDTFEQDQLYRTLGSINGNLVKIPGGINDGIIASNTETSYNIQVNNTFTLNGGAIDFSALKFAFDNGRTESAYGSTISDGVITFGAVDEKVTEKLYAYIGSSLLSNFCKFEMRFVLDPDYKVSVNSDTITVNAGEYVDLFALVEKQIDGIAQMVPSVIVTNKDENMLFLPYNYDVSKFTQFGSGFLSRFYYADAGGMGYYHIYRTLTLTGSIISGDIINGEVRFARSGVVNIVAPGHSSGYITTKININVSDAPQVDNVLPDFTDVTFDESGVTLNNYIAFTPSTAVVQITAIHFDVDGFNSNPALAGNVTFSEVNGTLKAETGMGTLDLLTITGNGGQYSLTKASGYDTAKLVLSSMYSMTELEFDLVVSYMHDGGSNTANLHVVINF